MDMPTLRGERVLLRPLTLEDVPRLLEFGDEPEVSRWWGPPSEEKLRAKAEGRDDATAFAVEAGGELIGLAQYVEETTPDFRHAGIDLFLTTARHGAGLGTDTVRTLARYLVGERGHHRVTIDPARTNERAIRCYERVGFRRVGILRRSWRASDGSWQDGLLLDLLAEELTG